MLNIVEGLLFLQDKKIIHLDLFLRNIMCYLEENSIIFKIIDFGFSEVNSSLDVKWYGCKPKQKPHYQLLLKTIEDLLDAPRIEAQQNKVKYLQDLSSGENKSKYMVCNHVLKRIPDFPVL